MSGTQKCNFDSHDVRLLRQLYEAECMPVHDIRVRMQCCTARLRRKIKELGLKRSRCMLQVGIETKRAKKASDNLDELDERMEPAYEESPSQRLRQESWPLVEIRAGHGRSLGTSRSSQEMVGALALIAASLFVLALLFWAEGVHQRELAETFEAQANGHLAEAETKYIKALRPYRRPEEGEEWYGGQQQ